ncbi:MAG: 16S rRNA (cytidine(1402)-2'-O)-methyltransferase [Actinomycetes bacterium]
MTQVERPAGRIVVVGTPIGNLGDLSPRAAEVLTTADIVACEDTRRTGRLFQLLGLQSPRFVRLDDHTEPTAGPRLVARAAGGEVVAVVSDAGMPALADPGGRIVALAAEHGVVVEVVPGPFAGSIAAVLSGLLDGAGRFCFEGFLPRRGAERSRRFEELATERRTLVIYEAPHRVAETIGDLVSTFGGDRRVALCRELTKLHETVWRGPLAEASEYLAESPPKGEYVVVVAGAEAAPPPDDDALRAMLVAERAGGASRRDAAAAVAAATGVAPNRVKRLATELDDADGRAPG